MRFGWMAGLALALGMTAWSGASAEEGAKPGILLVAFGTTTDAGQAAYGNIEKKVKAAFPGHEVKWAYSSGIVRKRLAENKGVAVPAPGEAAAAFACAGTKKLLVQSLHVVPGVEHAKTLDLVEACKGDMDVVHGRPLLWNKQDIVEAAAAVSGTSAAGAAKDAAVVWMGHGQEEGWGDAAYMALEYAMRAGTPNAFVRLVEGGNTLESALPELKRLGVKKVKLSPFLVVAGDHAQNDLAGDEEDSWKSILKKEGYDVSVELSGLGERDAIAAIYVRHLKEAAEEKAEE